MSSKRTPTYFIENFYCIYGTLIPHSFPLSFQGSVFEVVFIFVVQYAPPFNKPSVGFWSLLPYSLFTVQFPKSLCISLIKSNYTFGNSQTIAITRLNIITVKQLKTTTSNWDSSQNTESRIGMTKALLIFSQFTRAFRDIY